MDPGPDLNKLGSSERRARTPSWFKLAVLLALVLLCVRALDHPIPIAAYRVIDEQTLVVAVSGNGNWGTRVTSVEESPTTVTVSAAKFHFQPGPGTASAIPMELIVHLQAPLGSRHVVDGSTGITVGFSRCAPPGAYFAPGCT